jgi:hypothetical protein
MNAPIMANMNAPIMATRISWFAIIALVALLYVIIKGLANPRTRPFVIGLVVLAGMGLGIVCVLFVGSHQVREGGFQQVQRVEASKQVAPQAIALPPESPPKTTAAQTKRPKMTLTEALRQALVQAWIGQVAGRTAKAPEKLIKTSLPVAPEKPPLPEWVNAPLKMEDGRYTRSVSAGPFMTELECDRDLPRQIQAVVSEYAELSIGPEAAAVRLPDEVLRKFAQQKLAEHRTMEIGDGSQDMVTLYARVVFDDSAQEQIKSAVQQTAINQRVKGAAVILGGVLGILVLAWGGLRSATKRREAKAR